MMRILLIGKTGQLGWELCRTLSPLGEVTSVDYPEIDLGNPEAVRPLVRQLQPQVIVNAAAYTAVDQAEIEQEKARNINAIAPGVLAEEASRLKAGFIHYSTDYVFDGEKGVAYVEGDVTNPINNYGKSKLEGERLVQSVDGAYLILRTSWVYSLRQQGGFVNKVLKWSRQKETLRIVEDQIGSPTWARMLAEISALLLARGGDRLYESLRTKRGVYHVAGKGGVSRLEWARAILRYDPRPAEQRAAKLEAARSSEFPTPARRPVHSVLNCDHFEESFHLHIPDWEESLRLAMSE